jgi:predicted nucleic acid-binding protein
MLRRVLVDTGPLVAILSARDQYHDVCVAQLRLIEPPLFTCWPVLTEAAWLLRAQPSAIERLLVGVEEGLFVLLPMDASAAKPMALLMERYRKAGAQLADAALVYLAGREGLDTIFTLDRRDFTIYRTTPRTGNRKPVGRRLKIVPA